MDRRVSSLVGPVLVLTAIAVAISGHAPAPTPSPVEAATPASLTVILEVVPADNTRFTFDDAGGANLFSRALRMDLDPATAGFPDRTTFAGLANNTSYLLTQAIVGGYELAVVCTNDTGGRSILTPLADGISFRLRDSDALTCTFTNTNLAVAPPPMVDTTPPLLMLPPDFTVEATGPATVVTFDATATDDTDGPLPVDCTPASGDAFPLGAAAVNCTATDAAGNMASGSFTVTVEDTTSPTLTLPSNLTVEAAGAATPVLFEATATDLADPAPTVVCGPPSGSLFPLGVTTVDCTATDAAGNLASDSFTVTVEDTTPPVLTLPPDLTVEATGPTTPLSYEASAVDNIDGDVAVACVPESGEGFFYGVTPVNCTATDASDNTAAGSFNVTVEDTTPPALTLPTDIRVDESPPGGGSAVVTFEASAFDLLDGATSVSCAPQSGATFPLGVTTVACSSTDAAGNSAGGEFEVEVVAVPWSLTIELIVTPQQPTDIPLTVEDDQGGRGVILDDPVDNDHDTIPELELIEGTGNGVSLEVTAGPLPGFVVDSIRCTGGAALILDGTARLTLNAGDDVHCLFSLLDIDLDDDGLTDELEALLGTDPLDPDSDRDGVPDGEELLIRDTDPLDPADGGEGTATPPRRTFVPPLPPSGVALTHYGGGTVGELLADLEAAGATSALLSTADGRTVVLVVTDLRFVIEAFVEGYFGPDASIEDLFTLPIAPGTLLFVLLR